MMSLNGLIFYGLSKLLFWQVTPVCTKTTAGMLAQLLYDHHIEFTTQYPGVSIIPKMHYCLHLPRQIIDFGLPRNHWCMRFEAKHSFFKSQSWKCFKNLPKSVSTRHQKYMCYKRTGVNGELSDSFLYNGDIVKEGKEVVFSEKYPELLERLTEIVEIDPVEIAEPEGVKVYNTSSVTILGHEYRCGCCVVLDYEDDVPKFGILKDIIIKKEMKCFVVEEMLISNFERHALCYQLEKCNTLSLVPYSSLFSKWPLSIHLYEGKSSVINQFSHVCEPL